MLSASTGQVDTFNHGSLSSTPVTIFSADVCAWMRKDDVSTQAARTKLISERRLSNGASLNPPTVYQMLRDSYALDPNAGPAAWTATTINNSKIGYEHV